MYKTSILLGITAFAIGATVIFPHAAFAYKGDPNKMGPNYTEERHEKMEKAFENKDYSAWSKLMEGKGRVTQVINAQNFAKLAEAHELAEQGKTAEAYKIRTELGLGLQNGSGKGQGMGYGRMSR
jgi:hypothetical protein